MQKSISVSSTLEVTDGNGCKGLSQIQVLAKNCTNKMIFPNAFSPNNDGNNDIFKPFVLGKLISYKLSIYNGWGNEVFRSTDCARGWRGENASGTYIWVCEYQFADDVKTIQKGYMIETKE